MSLENKRKGDKMKLNLCIDIDGTITEDFYWLDLANKYFGKNIQPIQINEYDIDKVMGKTKTQYLDFYNEHSHDIHLNAKPREFSNLVLWHLSNQHNVSYVTAREPRLEDITNKWFLNNGIPTNDLHMLGSHCKVKKAEELNCHIFIEDRYENALEIALAGFQVLLMDTSYNRLPLIPGITRVYNWLEIYEEVSLYHSRQLQNIIVA